MMNELICKACKGSKAIAYSREVRPIGDTGLEREVKIPQTPKDKEFLQKVYPKSPPIGYRMTYEWGTVFRNEREVECVYVGMEKIESEPETPVDKALQTKNKAELVEAAVLAGITTADATWSKAQLISEIQKVKNKATT